MTFFNIFQKLFLLRFFNIFLNFFLVRPHCGREHDQLRLELPQQDEDAGGEEDGDDHEGLRRYGEERRDEEGRGRVRGQRHQAGEEATEIKLHQGQFGPFQNT